MSLEDQILPCSREELQLLRERAQERLARWNIYEKIGNLHSGETITSEVSINPGSSGWGCLTLKTTWDHNHKLIKEKLEQRVEIVSIYE